MVVIWLSVMRLHFFDDKDFQVKSDDLCCATIQIQHTFGEWGGVGEGGGRRSVGCNQGYRVQ